MPLHEYQKYARDFVIEHPYSALLLDMGLGKTLTTLTALDELINVFEVSKKVLIIAPKRVALDTWPTEIKKWEFDLSYSVAVGTAKQREDALAEDVDVYITNRESVPWIVDYYKTSWPFDSVIIDELSSFKSSKSQRWRALKKVRPKVERLVGLTGTPSPNGLVDLWSQMYLVDQGERLEKTKTAFEKKYFYPMIQNGHVVYKWGLKDDAEKEIYDRISDIAVSMKSEDYLKLPPRVDNIVKVNLEKKEKNLYNQLKKDYVLESEDSEITASNAAVLAGKLLQMASGAVYDEFDSVLKIHDRKLEALEQIVEDSQGQPILVFYQYKHDLERLKDRFKQAEELTDIDKWNRGEIPILLVHPQSAGHGLNLQYGGHIIVWFGLSWNLEYYQQANARLDRQGQADTVIVHHLVAEGTIDERVMDALQGKAMTQDRLMQAVKAELGGI